MEMSKAQVAGATVAAVGLGTTYAGWKVFKRLTEVPVTVAVGAIAVIYAATIYYPPEVFQRRLSTLDKAMDTAKFDGAVEQEVARKLVAQKELDSKLAADKLVADQVASRLNVMRKKLSEQEALLSSKTVAFDTTVREAKQMLLAEATRLEQAAKLVEVKSQKLSETEALLVTKAGETAKAQAQTKAEIVKAANEVALHKAAMTGQISCADLKRNYDNFSELYWREHRTSNDGGGYTIDSPNSNMYFKEALSAKTTYLVNCNYPKLYN